MRYRVNWFKDSYAASSIPYGSLEPAAGWFHFQPAGMVAPGALNVSACRNVQPIPVTPEPEPFH